MARKEMMAITRRRLAQYLSKASFASNVDRQAALDCLEELGDAIDAAPSASAPECDTCNGFIHVHDATGEYRGECPHCATSASAQQEPDEEDEESEGAIPPVHWDLFPGWLIDHHEGDTITEELLQHALADMLKVHPAAPARSASPICTCPSGDGSLRHPCPSHPSASPAALTLGQVIHKRLCEGNPEAASPADQVPAGYRLQPISEFDAYRDVLRDAERLDWLDTTNTPFRMGWQVGMAPAGNVSVKSVIQLGGTVTPIRTAIDAAMSASKEGV